VTALLSSLLPAFSPGQRIGLFGGSFNPAHQGHRAACLEAMRSADLDWVWWIVTPQNPLKTPSETEDFGDRLNLARLVAKHPRMLVSDIENRLGTRFTASTLARLKPVLDRACFVWIMGADSFCGLHRWNRWREIPALLPLIVLDRPGSTLCALSSPAARALERRRIDECDAHTIACRPPPAWTFLSLPQRKESSTAIRRPRGDSMASTEGLECPPRLARFVPS
jgi:nicotinate-nucleotide adenylyltransferase